MRRPFLRRMLALTLASSAGLALAQGFPSKPVTIVVPYTAGAAPDTLVRTLAPSLQATLGQSVVVENKPGASGNIGGAMVAKGPADGHVILLATQPMVTINPHLFPNLGYDPATELTPITAAVNVLLALSVANSVPVSNAGELIAYAKQHPGMSYGTSGVGTPMHLAGLRLARAAGVPMVHVPYKGGALVLNDLAGGNVQIGMVDFASSQKLAEAGKIKLLGIGEKERFSGAPQVPTVAETLPGFELTSWFGFFGPGGMPAEAIERWNQALNKALQDPAIKAKLFAIGMVTRPEGPAALGRLVSTEREAFGKSVRDNKISME